MKKLINVTQTALNALKAKGADNACCTASFSTVREFNVDNGRFSLYRTLYGNSLSVTALVGGKKGRAACNSFQPEDIATLCTDCVAAAAAGQADGAYVIAAENKNAAFTFGCPNCNEKLLFDRSKQLLEDIGKDYPLITIEQMIISHRKSETVYADLSGTQYTQTAGCYTVSIMYSAHKGEKTSSFFSSGVITDSLDTPFIRLGRIAAELAEVEKQIDTTPVTGKFTGTLILPPAALCGVISDALGNFAGGGALMEETTPWADMLGKQVAAESLTVELAPLDSRIVCGSRIGGEGFLNQNCTVIQNGVLKSFVLSRYAANKTGKAPSANTSGSYIIHGGNTPLADMIKGVKRGLWIGRLSGGSPASNGDFSAVAKNSFLIEDGCITTAVSETMVNGNLKDMLMAISAVSSETVADGDTVLPYVAVEGVVITGK